MKKIIFTLAVVFAMITVAKADADSYLYWMTDLDDGRYSTEGYYDTINILAKDVTEGGGTKYQVLSFYAGGIGGEKFTELTYDQVQTVREIGESFGGFYADLSGLSSSATFYIELLKDDASVAISDSIPYSTAVSENYIQNIVGGYFTPTAVPWTVAAPEPTSGLLMLLGMAALGLKRRKMTNA